APTDPPPTQTTFTFCQSLDDLTQNDIRKTIIEDLQRNTPKFTGDHRQDVLKWLKNVTNKFDIAGIPDVKRFEFISQLLGRGALDWFYDHKSNFHHSWSDFVVEFKRTFDSPNRARIAMQKLHSYTQSPQQDIRSFCSEMRKLFLEADPQMSSTMKLELLLAKVLPSYRLDLLKQKPKDSDAFELMAKDLESTYLVLEAIEQNVPRTSSVVASSTSSPASGGAPSSLSRPQAASSYPSPRIPFRPFTGPRSVMPTSSTAGNFRSFGPSSSGFARQPFSPRYGRGYANSHPSTRPQQLFTYQSSDASSFLPQAPVSSSTSFQSLNTSSASVSPSGGATSPPPLMALPNSSVPFQQHQQHSPPATFSDTSIPSCHRCFGRGHTVTETSITPTADAIQDLLALPEPRTLKQANKFLGGLAYYRKFVPGFADVAAPIHQVTNLTTSRRHLFQWTAAQSAAFHALKRLLTTSPLFLRFPIDGFPLHLATDASGVATGGVLYQDVDGHRRNLFYHSKLLSAVEQKYSVPEKEALAIFLCLQRMRPLILGRAVHIHTDHCPICGMLQKPVNNRRIERVANLIQEYQIAEMIHIDGKANCLADFLSRPFDDPLFDVPYGLESKFPLNHISSCLRDHGLSTMTLRPRRPAQLPPRPVILTSASATSLSASDASISDADSTSISSASSVSSSSSSTLATTPSPNGFDSTSLVVAQHADPVLRAIIEQLANPTAPATLTSSFILKNDVLHKLLPVSSSSPRDSAVPYLPSSMVKSLLIATHDDPYQGGHFSTDKMFSKLKYRYWWPSMRRSIRRHVQACTLCQQFNITRKKPAGHLHPVPPTAVPFSVIGMDYCGPFVTSSNENKYVLVVTDLFSRFVTAIPLPSNTANVTALTLFRYIFCKYGVCSTLITDQGTHFNNQLMRAFQHLLGYHHILSTPYHPQSNGIVERFNASMVVQLSKLQQQHHNNWDDYIDPIVFAYNTSTHKTTKFSPFELLFGRAAQLPIDNPPRSFVFDRPNNYFVYLQKLLHIYHQQAEAHILAQQSSTKLRYDRGRADPRFVVGDRVFTRIFAPRTKLDARYSADPQIVVHVDHPTYIVRNLSTGLERSYHVSTLRSILLDSANESQS
ncbi:unnamed protein product, partial [Adineta ricciae]